MDANQNPPSEREWTEQEKEEFFASPDAITGLINGAVASNHPGWFNAMRKPTRYPRHSRWRTGIRLVDVVLLLALQGDLVSPVAVGTQTKGR